MAQIGRALQYLALLILPFGLSAGLFGNNIGLEVKLLWIGGAVFVIGWLLSRKSSP